MSAPARGALGEAQAEAYLKSKGYAILERGYRQRFGELDIVARLDGTVVFVEVKARAASGFGGPAAAVTRSKQARLARTAAAWLKARRPAYDGLRFDVVALGPEGLVHYENAFESPIRFTL